MRVAIDEAAGTVDLARCVDLPARLRAGGEVLDAPAGADFRVMSPRLRGSTALRRG